MITEVVPAPASAHRTRWSRTPRDDPTRAANTQGPWAPPSKYSSEFKEDAVRIVLQSGKTISETARELGLNENTNRLLRQYLPKGADLRRFRQADLDAIAHELNHRPRKIHGYRTPAEVYVGLLNSGDARAWTRRREQEGGRRASFDTGVIGCADGSLTVR
ncbi:hypothetical protein GCM10010358_66050 [Streptomyces minutiscleroticus]|uniref:Transposase n=1 Tax=Streptomyces minutiscleroticus TaxID=68238 RepID=A0A918U756_9ACTN|nr:hypothetical protein GCM10010358_66050 [Streptomyces minutiscleroticus]